MAAAGTAVLRPTLEDVATLVWECEALEACGDVETARRLTAARYWLESRRGARLGRRVFRGPARPGGREPCDD